MKKLLKWGAAVVGIPLLLFATATVLLYLPPIQNWAAKKVAAYASEQTGMDISVGRVRLRFPLDLSVEEFRMFRQNDSIPNLTDTIADVKRLDASIEFFPLLKKKINIDKLQLNEANLNTDGFIPDTRIKGKIGNLYIESKGIDLKAEQIKIDAARLKNSKLDIALADTVPPDTTKSETKWKINVDKLDIEKTALRVHLPGDTLNVNADIGKAEARNGFFDLGSGEHKLHHFNVKNTNIAYDNRFEKTTEGLDTNHLKIENLNLTADSLYYKDPKLDVAIKQCSFNEKSGLLVKELSGNVNIDLGSSSDEKNNEKKPITINVPNLHLVTSESQIDANVNLNLGEENKNNLFNTNIDCKLGKNDLMRFMGSMPSDFRRQWPNKTLAIRGNVYGNTDRIDFRNLDINLPTAISANASGWVANIGNSDKLKADVNIKAKTGNLDFAKSLLDKETQKSINIPNNISIEGNVKADGSRYAADINVGEGGGHLDAKVDVNTKTQQYAANIKSRAFPVNHFVKGVNLSPFTGKITASGQGFDPMSPKTRLTANANIERLTYEGNDLSGTQAKANINNGKITANIKGNNSLFGGDINLNATTNSKLFKGTITGDIDKLDLKALRVSDEPLTPKGCVHLDIITDFNDYYDVKGTISDMALKTKSTVLRPDDIELDLLLRRDTTHAVVDCGDFHLNLNGKGGYKQILNQTERLTAELNSQLKNRRLNQSELWKRLPDANIYLHSGNNNLFTHMLKKKGYMFNETLLDIKSSHTDGINGIVKIDSLVADSIMIDRVELDMTTQDNIFRYSLQAQNDYPHPQYVFKANINGTLSETGSDMKAQFYDKEDKLGLDLGLTASIEEGGMRLTLTDTSPIIAYKKFNANKDNYIYLSDDKRLSANMQLTSEDNMGVQLYTNDDNEEALQDLTLSLHKFELEPLMKSLPYLPNITGTLNGDYHIIQTPDQLSISTAMTIDKMKYEGCDMGNLGTEFVYMPKAGGEHYIDGILLQNEREVGTIEGTYKEQTGDIDATLELEKVPLELANGFIPEQLFGLRGFGEGTLSMKGKLNKPNINGEIYLDSSYVFSQPYGVDMRFANDPVRIVNSKLLLENFELFAYNDQPLNMAGSIDFANLDKIMFDLRMRARNFQIINAKENPRSETYGKAFVNFFGTMRGPADKLQMRGKLDVLGSTDMTYILRDSPLTTDNRLNELVTFTDFNDTAKVVVAKPQIGGMNMDLSISIDENAHIKCDLNSDHSNYIDLMGGGNLRMQYNNIDNLRLTGRYTLANGEMKYSLPIIPLKTFTIQDGSYLEFLGDAMNPRLNITATERMKATVGSDGGNVRSVDFDCGVVITKTLNDMGLEFIIDSPEDIAIRNELNTLSKEERGKIAVTMLTTGMYLADGNTSGFTMNGALSSFLQNEINNLTGSALRTLDLSFGVDNATDASGNLHTDYSFKFAKRFWNNRLRIVVGGKLSSGPDVAGQNQSFFDNVTFEYRLNENANKYLKLFYNRNSYDWIEGNVGEYGAGFLWRRKVQHFKDLFRFKSDTPTRFGQMPRRDSIKVNKTDTTNNTDITTIRP